MEIVKTDEVWKGMVKDSLEEIENFNDFVQDKDIVWANKEMVNYKNAMLALIRSNSNWPMGVTDEEEKLVNTMLRRAEAQK